MIIGYARVSTDDQTLDSQTDALTATGAERIFADKISGSKRDRPELGKLLDQLRPGDVVGSGAGSRSKQRDQERSACRALYPCGA